MASVYDQVGSWEPLALEVQSPGFRPLHHPTVKHLGTWRWGGKVQVREHMTQLPLRQAYPQNLHNHLTPWGHRRLSKEPLQCLSLLLLKVK